MTETTSTPTVGERLAALAASADAARKAQAEATLGPLAALIAQAGGLSIDEIVQVIKGLLPLMIEDTQEKMALANATLILPGLPGALKIALQQAEKASA